MSITHHISANQHPPINDNAQTPIAVVARPLEGSDHARIFSRPWHIMVSAAHFSATDLTLEPELSCSTWAPYRHLTPHQRDITFALDYQETFKRYFRENVDREMSVKVKGINIRAIRNPKRSALRGTAGQLTAVNSARQNADTFGIPYHHYIRFCMDFAGARGVQKILRPNQLIPKNIEYLEVWLYKINERKTEWSGGEKHWEETDFGKIDLNREPGCFGVPGAHSGTKFTCQSCPFVQKCRTGGARILARMDSQGWQIHEAYRTRQRAVAATRDRDRHRRLRGKTCETVRPHQHLSHMTPEEKKERAKAQRTASNKRARAHKKQAIVTRASEAV